MTFQVMYQFTGFMIYFSLNNGQVSFFKIMGAELFTQAAGGFGGPAEQNHSGHRPVQTMYKGQEYIAGFLISLSDPVLCQVQERNIPGMIPLHKQACWFI